MKYKKYKSPIYSAAKTITLILACVSMLTLETTLLTTFGNETPLFNRIMLGSTGTVIAIFTITIAFIMIIKGTKKLKYL